MPVDPWCYYRAFKMTAQGNDTVIFLIGLFSTPPQPPPPHGCCPSLLTFPECLPASETPSNTRWHLERRRRKGKKDHLRGRRDRDNEKLYALTSSGLIIWRQRTQQRPKGRGIRNLDSSTKQKKEIFLSATAEKKKTTIGRGGWLCRCAAVLLKSARGRFARLPYPPPPSCKECSFLSWSEGRVKPL